MHGAPSSQEKMLRFWQVYASDHRHGTANGSKLRLARDVLHLLRALITDAASPLLW